MDAVRKYVEDQYLQLIEDATTQYEVNNTFFILEPKIMDIKNTDDEM